ncbi:MAG TPA: ATP-binding protein [Anaerolineaceae bacterium]|nr:ATP-binding protein [Anaerolineaceae bacterium]
MNFKPHLSLRWRTALAYILLFIVAIGGLSIYLAKLSTDNLQNALRDHLLTETRLLAQQTGAMLQGGSTPAQIEEYIRQSASLSGSRVTIILPDGSVLAESSLDPVQMENHHSRPEFQQALAGQEATDIHFSDTLATQMLYTAVPVKQDGQVTAVVRMALPMKQIEAQLQTIRLTILIAAGLVILLGILLSILLTAYTTQPLRRLTDNVLRITPAEGNSEPQVTSRRMDEIRRLEHAFNRLENQLKAQVNQFQAKQATLTTILEQMTDGILIIDQDGTLQHINPAALTIFHITAADPAGQSLTSVVRQHQLVDLWRKSLHSGQTHSTTIEISLESLFIQAIASPLGEAMPGSTLVVIQDLTRLRHLEMVRRDFVSNVSHELRTPLASLKALTETLQEGALEDPPAARRFLQRMEHEIDNLTQMVRELLELSRIESGKVPLVRRMILPQELASPAVERMQMQAERAGLKMHLEIPADLPQVNADPERVEQVLVNLLHNAIKFTPQGGEIYVGARPDKGTIVFSVRDTGVGMDAEALPRIFERFYKADRSRAGGGTGLGLSIARHIIEAHNGRIWATSEIGKGSTFYFSLPLI